MKIQKKNKNLATLISALITVTLLISSCDGKKEVGPSSAPVVNYGGTKTVPGNAEKGKIVYDKYCYYCHGREGRGDGAIGIAVTPHPVDFVSDKRKMSKSDEELLKSISEGIRREVGGDEMAMPRWKDILSQEQMLDALAYVRELSRRKTSSEIAGK